MKICCISDLHGTIPKLPHGIDLLLIAGDLAWENTTAKEESWFKNKFNPWISSLNIPCIYIAGNHDFYLEKYGNDVGELIENNYSKRNDIIIYGTPLSLEVGPWVYQSNEQEINETLKKVICDILISHGPPYGYGDKVLSGKHVGSIALKDYIVNYQPKLVVNGHIHPARGLYKIGETTILNCAITDDNCTAIGKVYVVDWNVADKCIESICEWDSCTSEYRQL